MTVYAHASATYTLRSIDGAKVQEFELDRFKGNLKTTKPLDAAKESVYELQAEAAVDPFKDKANITITVLKTNRKNPVFEKNEYIFKINGSVLHKNFKFGQVKATTETGNISYSVLYYNDQFGVCVRTGHIFAKQNLLKGRYSNWKIVVLACNDPIPELNEEKRCTDVYVTVQIGDPPPDFTDYAEYYGVKMDNKPKPFKIPGLTVLGCIVGAMAVVIVVELALLLPGSRSLDYLASQINLLTPPQTPHLVPPPTPNPVTVPVSPNTSSIQQVPE